MWDTLVQYFWFISRIYFIQKGILKPTNRRVWRKTGLIKNSNNKGANCKCYPKFEGSLTLKQLGEGGGGSIWPLPTRCGFSKNVFSKKRMKTCFFGSSNIITEIPQVVQKIWRIYLSILVVFIDFNQFFWFLTIPCYKETNDVSL